MRRADRNIAKHIQKIGNKRMIKTFSTKGKKYTLHIKDATEVGGKNIVRWSENDLNRKIGVTVLMPEELTVDELVNLVRKHFGVNDENS